MKYEETIKELQKKGYIRVAIYEVDSYIVRRYELWYNKDRTNQITLEKQTDGKVYLWQPLEKVI